MLFAIGVCGTLGFYDKVLGFSDQMRYFNSGILVVISIVLLIRTWIKIRTGKMEKLIARNSELEKLAGQLGHKNINEEPEIAVLEKR